MQRTRENRPTLEQIERELLRRDTRRRRGRVLRIVLLALLAAVAVAAVAATLWLPILRVSGASMTPVLDSGDIVVVAKTNKFECGEIVAFYYNNKILIKRVVAGGGDWVDIDADGNVYVNDIRVEEPYAVDKGEGECDITFPYQVPEDSWFVLGDHRSTSVDSRSSSIGCISDENMLGRVVFRVYPLNKIRWIS